MAKGFTVVRSDSLEGLESSMDDFLENPTVQDIKDVSYQQAMEQSPLGAKIVWIAFIIFEYDKAMQAMLDQEENGQQILPITEEKNKE